MKTLKPHYHHGDLRNALVRKAVELVEESGADSFSLREAGRLVGVSANAAYRHFVDKSDLMTAVAEFGFRRLERRVVKALLPLAGAPPIDRLKAAGRAYVAFAVERPELLRVMFGSGGLATLDVDVEPKPAGFVLIGQALDDLASRGILPAERRRGAELKAWTVAHGFALLLIQAGGTAQREAARAGTLESLLDFALTGLCGRIEPTDAG